MCQIHSGSGTFAHYLRQKERGDIVARTRCAAIAADYRFNVRYLGTCESRWEYHRRRDILR